MSWGSLWGDSDYYYGGTPSYNDYPTMPSSASSPTAISPGASTVNTGSFGFFPSSIDWNKPVNVSRRMPGDDPIASWITSFIDWLNPWSPNKSEKGVERIIDSFWHGDADYSVKEEEKNLLADQNKYVDLVTQMQMAGFNPFASTPTQIADKKDSGENKAKMLQMMMMMMMMMGIGRK